MTKPRGESMDELARLREEIVRLERSNRTARRFSVVAVTLALLPVALGAKLPRTVEAERFALVDRGGRPRAELQSNAEGGAELAFRDEKGVARLRFALEREGRPTLVFNDEEGHLRTKLAVARDSSLSFYDERGK